MSRKRVTSRQVAERAGVSRTTVSFVLNDVEGSNISQATRERVLEAAEELGYVPSAAARTLVSGRTGTLGLILGHAEHLTVDAFIPQLLYGLNDAIRRHGFRLLVEAVEDIGRADAYRELVHAKQIDGLVALNPRSDDEQLPRLIEEGFPVVVIGDTSRRNGYAVNVDDRVAARRATEHLLALGHRRVAHLTFSPEGYLATRHRLAGYREALEAAGVDPDETPIAYGNYGPESGYRAMRDLLASGPPPSALFAGNDTVALGAMAAIRERGLGIPDDVAVVGFDDIPTAPFFSPPLTTIRSPAIEQGRLAMELLVALVAGERPEPSRITLDTPLVVRASCGAERRPPA